MLPLRHLEAREALVTPGGLSQSLVGRKRFEKRIDEDLAIESTQCENLMIPDGARCDFLGAAHNELRQRAAGKICRMLEQGLLRVREPGLESCCFGSELRSFDQDVLF
jgi:hypothetical protein